MTRSEAAILIFLAVAILALIVAWIPTPDDWLSKRVRRMFRIKA